MDSSKLPTALAKLEFSAINSALLRVVLLVACLLMEGYRTNFPKVPNIPKAPGYLPFLGHLHALGGRRKLNDATVFSQWGHELDSGIFQVRFGNQRNIVVSSWAAMKELWIVRNTSLLDRPHHKGFLDHIGVDISGSPMTEQIRKYRTAALKALGKPMWPGYFPLIEHNAVSFVKALYEKGENRKKPMEMYPWLRQMMLDLTLNLTYGARAGAFDDALTNSLLNSRNAIISVRGSTAEYGHFVPILRIVPKKSNNVMDAVKERQRCIAIFYGQYLQKVRDGDTPTCIVSSLGADKLTLDEIHGTCMSLLQAAPDTVSSSVYQCIAWLCVLENLPFQKEVLEAILEAYGGDRDLA